MAVTVRFFAILRETLGIDSLRLDIEKQQTVAEVLGEIKKQYPQLEKFEPVLSYAVNDEYAKLDVKLKDGDELALLPPISGG
jgi:molybdopterin converting factor subunit 1